MLRTLYKAAKPAPFEKDESRSVQIPAACLVFGQIASMPVRELRIVLEISVVAEVVKTFDNTVAPKLLTSSATTRLDSKSQDGP